MIRVQTTLGIQIGNDANFDITYFSRNPNDAKSQSVVDRFTDQITNTVVLPSDQTRVTLSLGGLKDVRGFYLELTGGPCSMLLNGSLVPISILPADVGMTSHLFMEAGVTAVVLYGPPGIFVQGVYTMWGFNTPQAM
jgi:hypothetical protein